MRIGIQTWGSAGDIRPLLALAYGLKARGHEVRFIYSSADNADHGALAAALGINARRVGHLAYDIHEQAAIGRRILSARTPLGQLKIIMDALFDPLLGPMTAAARELADGSDLLIGHFLCHFLGVAGEAAGRPMVSVTPVDIALPSRYLTPAGWPKMGIWGNRIGWWMFSHILDLGSRATINRLRGEFNLGPIEHVLDMTRQLPLVLVAASPALTPRPADWPEQWRVGGYLELPEQAATEWQPSLELSHFLDAGEAPVFITFGSMGALKLPSTDMVAPLVAAVKKAGCRAIIQAQWDAIGEQPDEPAIFAAGHLPHAPVFARCHAVVHHGGAGTTHAATLAGCASIVVPHLVDQHYWGALLYRRGLAPAPIPYRRLHADGLARALRQVMADPAYRQRSQSMASAMRGENGVEQAVALIERMV